jgi:hypothetical protein
MVNDLTVTLFGHQALNSQMSFKDTLSLLQELDLIDIGELAEKAVAKKTGVKQTSKCQEGYDLENGWEIESQNNWIFSTILSEGTMINQ